MGPKQAVAENQTKAAAEYMDRHHREMGELWKLIWLRTSNDIKTFLRATVQIDKLVEARRFPMAYLVYRHYFYLSELNSQEMGQHGRLQMRLLHELGNLHQGDLSFNDFILSWQEHLDKFRQIDYPIDTNTDVNLQGATPF